VNNRFDSINKADLLFPKNAYSQLRVKASALCEQVLLPPFNIFLMKMNEHKPRAV
jgi:hypothetical protein